ncbi:MAG TPA: DinB family protein [Candidatus Eisenbacteria bacterium]|nr:DinB family protein [Candidatus Eisenbacteria bacterium]
MTFRVAVFLLTMLAALVSACGQKLESPAKAIRANFVDVDRKLLEMAKDWPADNYDYKLRPEMRTFGAVMVHIASGNVFAAKVAKGEKVTWDELDPKSYPDKAAVVALLEKSFADSEAALKSWPDEHFSRQVEPWLDVLEHSAEHYGLLVAYNRANGMVPPESRPKK